MRQRPRLLSWPASCYERAVSRLSRRSLLRGVLPSLAVGFGATFALSACAAPTLPLPPPAQPTVSEVGTNLYLLRGVRSVEPHAIVLIYKNDVSLPLSDRVDASQSDGEGTWEKLISAKPGTVLDIWQDTGGARSPEVVIQLPRAR